MWESELSIWPAEETCAQWKKTYSDKCCMYNWNLLSKLLSPLVVSLSLAKLCADLSLRLFYKLGLSAWGSVDRGIEAPLIVAAPAEEREEGTLSSAMPCLDGLSHLWFIAIILSLRCHCRRMGCCTAIGLWVLTMDYYRKYVCLSHCPVESGLVQFSVCVITRYTCLFYAFRIWLFERLGNWFRSWFLDFLPGVGLLFDK